MGSLFRMIKSENGIEHRKIIDCGPGCETGQVSDGYHTFNELYQHRHALFCALARALSSGAYTWKSRKHWIDSKLESAWDGWFVAGIELGLKDGRRMITYHLPLEY